MKVDLTRREVLMIYGMIFSHPNPNPFISASFGLLIKKFSDFKIYPSDDNSQILGNAAPEMMEFELSEAERIAIRKIFLLRLRGTKDEQPIPYGVAVTIVWPLAKTLDIDVKLKEEYEKTLAADKKAEGITDE